MLSSEVRRWKERFFRSVERRGLSGTVVLALKAIASFLSEQWRHCTTRNPWNPWFQFLDRRYDRRYAVNTAGIDLIPELSAPSQANAYSPVPRSTFFDIVRRVAIDHSKFVFIDFGCGKGKPLLLASELPFKSIIGLELSPRLAKIAEENLKSYRGPRSCSALQVICMDATEYEIPDEPAICYFYDPFHCEVMARVLDNIRSSFLATPREIVIIYLDPSWRQLMDDSDFLIPIETTNQYCIYRSCENAAVGRHKAS